jgi:hypothetical protein
MRIVFTSINQGRQLFAPRGPVEEITFPMNCRGKIIPFPSDISRFSRDTTRQQVGLQKFALRVKGRFNPFRDSVACTIVYAVAA